MTSLSRLQLRANVLTVNDRIARAAAASGRDPSTIKLISVSKTFPVSSIEAASAIGLREFGENRVQEALQKMEQTSKLAIRWHLIGHLQSNKTRSAASRFDWIHSVDSEKLLRRLDAAAADAGTTPCALVQVDLASEARKHGANVDDLRKIFEVGQTCRAIKVRGLMLIPPSHPDPEMVRPYFRRLREVQEELKRDGVHMTALQELSMGMSHDFDVAIQEGATMVRVGTALFGRRTPPVHQPDHEGA